MLMNRSASSPAPGTLRVFGFAVAYALAMATGTAMLIGTLGSYDDGRSTGTDGTSMTRAELVMKQAAERGVKPTPDALLLAARSLPNDKRGY